jgi:two-component SAPR family response regulator
VDSWAVHPAGYLLKPVTREALQEEVDYIRTLRARRKIGPAGIAF